MILNFHRPFKKKILAGIKIHTLREDRHNRWTPGRPMQMATGARTAEYEQFAAYTCTGVQEIEIKYIDDRGAVEITIDGRHFGTYHRFLPKKSINMHGIIHLAINDGFEDVEDFLRWFKRDWKGHIIHWTDFRY